MRDFNSTNVVGHIYCIMELQRNPYSRGAICIIESRCIDIRFIACVESNGVMEHHLVGGAKHTLDANSQ